MTTCTACQPAHPCRSLPASIHPQPPASLPAHRIAHGPGDGPVVDEGGVDPRAPALRVQQQRPHQRGVKGDPQVAERPLELGNSQAWVQVGKAGGAERARGEWGQRRSA